MTEHVEEHDLTMRSSTIKTTPWMVFFAFYIGLSGWVVGFDNGYGGVVLAMPSFNKAFGTCTRTPLGRTVCELSATRQSVGSIYQLFAALGCGISAVSSRYAGRRGALQIGCLLVLIGAAGMLGSSGNYTNYLVCKCISAVGLGHYVAMSSVYGVECVAPQKRGMLIALYGLGIASGSVVVGAVCLGSSTITDDWAWKTPIICQIPISVIYGLGLMMFPESPRWLMVNGKEEKARRSFARFYNIDPFSEGVTKQIRAVQDGIDFERSISTTTSWVEIFYRTNIRRTITAASITSLASLSGIWFITTYAALYLRDLGYSSLFLINVIFGVCLMSGCVVSPFVVELLGRRLAILAGYGSMAMCMLIFSAVSSGLGPANTSAKNVLVAFLCLWSISYGATIACTTWLASAEMHSVRLRTYGQAFASTLAQIIAFAASFWTPYMINPRYGNMGTNVGYFYFGITVFIIIVMFCLVPETARLSLEQIDDVFASGRPAWKTSLRRNKRISNGEEFDVSTEVRNAAIQRVRENKVASS